jgi:receptor expression-enhancing protein 1/2/3/4
LVHLPFPSFVSHLFSSLPSLPSLLFLLPGPPSDTPRIPFYPWLRAGFLLYLILPQSQGARLLYETHLQPFLLEHELAIDDFISSAHDRVKTAGLSYLKRAVELLKEYVLGIAPPAARPPAPPSSLTYAQSLIARFNIPAARSSSATGNVNTGWGTAAASVPADFYALLASAVSAATGSASTFPRTADAHDLSNSGSLIPPSISGLERASFISAQRERLAILLSALDREARQVELDATTTHDEKERGASSPRLLPGGAGDEAGRRTSQGEGMSKRPSEPDFEKIERSEAKPPAAMGRQSTGGWMPWNWNSAAGAGAGAVAGAGSPAAAAPGEKEKEEEEEDVVMGEAEQEKAKSSAVEL